MAKLLALTMEGLGYDELYTSELHNVIGLLRGKGDRPTLLHNGHIAHASASPAMSSGFPSHYISSIGQHLRPCTSLVDPPQEATLPQP